jgi:hypothetical protein
MSDENKSLAHDFFIMGQTVCQFDSLCRILTSVLQHTVVKTKCQGDFHQLVTLVGKLTKAC